MRRLPWAAVALVASTLTLNLVFVGCGSETEIDSTTDGGGADGSTTNDGSTDTDGSTASDGGVVNDGSVDPRTDAAACEVVGSDCASSAECCSTNCNATTGKCEPAASLCKAPDESCTTANECCTLTCFGGKCGNKLCSSDGVACQVGSECCGGTCTGGTCTPLNATCKTAGNQCAQNGDCCSKLCNNGVCSQAVSFCVQNGDVCSTDFECCGGACTKAAGASLGTCGTVTAPGVPGCQAAGEVCAAAGVTDCGVPECGGACCSRSCGPNGAFGGLSVCQPPSGCRPTGELCRQDSDCCGHAGSPDPKKGFVVCSKVAGSQFGRCDNGQACREPGSICKPADYSCNAENGCCDPVGESSSYCQSNPENCCARDALGIPRCLVKPVDCTNNPPPMGSTCATSADCCGNPCVNNQCGGTCVPKGGSCTTNADCCPGIPCVAAPGSTSGICGGVLVEADGGVVPPPDGGTATDAGADASAPADAGTPCALYGQTCAADGECCSGVPCTSGRCRFP